MIEKPPIVAIDFDGTLVTHAYPKIGAEIGAWTWVRALQSLQARLILFTMRSGYHLQEAVDLCTTENVRLWGVNDNPEQGSWTTSRKVYANIYVDDAALGVPLKCDPDLSSRPFVDWSLAGPLLLHNYCAAVKG